MKDVCDFAGFFIKNDADSVPNTYAGNMKLQKLLDFIEGHGILGRIRFSMFHR